jgi:poly-gamma-glutamate synthesis protein (capsule biosynthesis protein)
LLPVLAVLLAPVTAFLWFAASGPLTQGKPPLKLLGETPGIILRAGGNIMLAGNMEALIGAEGADFPFRNISGFWAGADCGYAGLETALADTGSPLPGKPLTLIAAPQTADSLALSGLTLLGLASSHMMDYDETALLQTISLLDGAGIAYMGAGENAAAAVKPYSVSQRGLRVALLDFCQNADVFYSYQYPKTLAAGENQAGVANLEEEAVLAAIAAARRNHDAVVLNLHWGEELSQQITPAQRELAHRFIEGGADVIVGRLSSGLQGVEIYNNGLIVYSLGNLILPQNSARQAREGALLELELTPLGWKSARLYPLLLSSEGQPALAAGREAADVMARLRAISPGLNATLLTDGDTLKISQ